MHNCIRLVQQLSSTQFIIEAAIIPATMVHSANVSD